MTETELKALIGELVAGDATLKSVTVATLTRMQTTAVEIAKREGFLKEKKRIVRKPAEVSTEM